MKLCRFFIVSKLPLVCWCVKTIGGVGDVSGASSCLGISVQESTTLYFSLNKLIPNGKSEHSQLSVLKDEQKCIMNTVDT